MSESNLNDLLCVDKPDCAILMMEWATMHEYQVPAKGEDMLRLITWMLSVYEDVQFSEDFNDGDPVYSITGTIRST